jgi:cobalt-zinc-cadmium efflux system outer membrane protein
MKFLIFGMLLAGAAHASPLPEAPGLLAPEIVLPLLEQDPEVMAARAGLDVARQDAKALEESPYEWTARVNAHRRTTEPGARSNEWNVGLERTLRLPAKGSADRRIAAATLDEGKARYRGAWRAASRELIDQWLDWLAAREGQSLAMAHQQAARENLAAVEKRVKAGDASRLDASLARAESAEQQRAGNEARTASAVAWAKLHARFPALPEQVTPVPSAVALSLNAASLRERILERNAMLQTAQAQLRKAQAQSERARAEKVPDPTVGVYTASEARNQERITGVMLSIPIPGAQRRMRANSAVYAAELTRQELELKKRELEGSIATMLAMTEGAYAGWQIADSGAAAMRDNAALTQRAYELGEVDLQSLLTAGRLATSAEQTALSAKVAATRAYFSLLLEANLLWERPIE